MAFIAPLAGAAVGGGLLGSIVTTAVGIGINLAIAYFFPQKIKGPRAESLKAQTSPRPTLDKEPVWHLGRRALSMLPPAFVMRGGTRYQFGVGSPIISVRKDAAIRSSASMRKAPSPRPMMAATLWKILISCSVILASCILALRSATRIPSERDVPISLFDILVSPPPPPECVSPPP
ncbi:hypothetical protein [Mesorhizobium sp. NFR06]|uniref:hypothetical protein n=1 Tax=Mesorhizobium sp. NFR06 TaxID=1566290 RepID=UPI00165FFDE7